MREIEPRWLTLKQVMSLTGMGESSARTFCNRIGARRKLSERVIRYDREVIEKAINATAEAET